jgi:hypothetical protein
MSDSLGAYPDWPIVKDGWDVQRIFEYLTKKCRMKPQDAVLQLNTHAQGIMQIVHTGSCVWPLRQARWAPGEIIFRLNGNKVETVYRGSLVRGEELVLKALPDKVRTTWLEPIKRRAGDVPRHDWLEAKLYVEKKLWPKRGDPLDAENRKEDWKSDSDLHRAVIEHLAIVGKKSNPDYEPPDISRVATVLRPTLQALRNSEADHS